MDPNKNEAPDDLEEPSRTVNNPPTFMDLTTFTKFPSLPIELQLEIFELSIPGPQLITISAEETPIAAEYTTKTWAASYKVPTILHINKESRNLGERIYKLEFKNNFAGAVGVWMDISKDILYFETELSFYRFFGSGRIRSHEVDGYRVKQPIFDKVPALAFSRDAFTRKFAHPRLLNHMGRPQKLYAVLENQEKLLEFMNWYGVFFKKRLGYNWLQSNWLRFFDYDKPKVVGMLLTDLKTELVSRISCCFPLNIFTDFVKANSNPPIPKSKRIDPKLAKTFLKMSSCQYLL